MSSGIRFPKALATLGGGPDLLESDHIASLDEFPIGDEGPRWSCSINSTHLQGGAWSADVVRGTARHLARRHGVEVTGVDLTAEYVQVATSLTGLAGRAQFQQGSGTAKIPGAIGVGRATDASRTMPTGLRNRLVHEIRDRAAQNSRSALDLHLVMAPDLALKIANMVASLELAVVAPTGAISPRSAVAALVQRGVAAGAMADHTKESDRLDDLE